MTLLDLYHLPLPALETQFLHCCGSKKWARLMIQSFPFKNESALFLTSEEVFKKLEPNDWLEAFKSHPAIGAKKVNPGPGSKSPEKSTKREDKWAEEEQAGVQGSPPEVILELAQKNEEYYNKFGFVFLICATGKSGSEMLESLKIRIKNNPDAELETAATEQVKITRLRLEKLLK